MWSTSVGGHLMKVVNLTGFTIYIYIYITRLASNEIFSPINKIHREVGLAKDLSTPLYLICSTTPRVTYGI